MAEEVIGLRIQLNGINTVIRDAETFEKVLKEAKEDLIDIGLNFGVGSTEYKKLAVEIKKAEGDFNRIKNGTKAARQELEEYRRGTETLTKAFAGATAALTLFGGESEEVSRAQKVAAQGLSVVIAAQSIAQTELGGATIATTIATRAQTIATNTSSTALKGLFGVIAANPIGALIAVIGLAVVAFNAFTSSADEAAKAQEEFNKSVQQDAGKNLATFRQLTKTIDDTSLSLVSRKKAIEDLKKQYPGYADDLTDEQILVGELKTRYKDLELAIIEAARAKAAQTKIEELSGKELDLLEKLEAATLKRVQAEKDLKEAQSAAPVTGGGSVPGLGGQGVNLVAYEQRLNAATEAERKAKQAFQDNQTELNKYGAIVAKNTEEIDKYKQAQAEAAETEEENTKKTKAAEEAQRKLLEAYKQRIAEQLKFIELQNRINQSEGEISALVVEQAQKFIKEAEDLIKLRGQFFKTESESLVDEINDILFKVIPTGDQFKALQDEYLKLFTFVQFRSKELFSGLTQGTTITLQTIIDNQIRLVEKEGKLVGDALEKEKTRIRNQYKDLNDEQQIALLGFFNRLQQTVDLYSGQLTIDGNKIAIGSREAVRTGLNEGIQAATKILKDPAILKGLKDTEIEKALTKIFPEFEKIDTTVGPYREALVIARQNLLEFVKVQSLQLQEQDKVNIKLLEYKKTLQTLRLEQGVLIDNIKEYNAENVKLGLGENILTEEQTKKLIARFRLTEEQLAIFVEKFGKAAAETPQIFAALVDDITANLNQYEIKLGREGIIKLFNEIGDNIAGTLEGKTQKELEALLKLFEEYAKKLEGTPFAGTFNGLIDNISDAINKLPENAQKAIKVVDQSLRELQKSLGNLSQVFGDAFNFQLEQLESNYKKSTDAIVGDTKEANNKRIELEKGYQKDKKEIEKRARLTALRITLAETIASGAQGVVQAITAAGGNPAVAAIFAAINASITGVQVGLIAQQISFVQSLRRGGKLASGGLVSGPSHENGGVRFMNGGVELEGNEAIINRNSTIQYGSLLSTINQAQGGRPILVGNSMDSRLIEVLAKQKQEPIRAYVIEGDITRAQNINKKLEQLATF